jgi:AcrR family transcriptional regulator
MSTLKATAEYHRVPRLPPSRPGPRGGKRDANRRLQVASICQAALELFCDTGVESVTIDEIVARAGVAKGSFYRYFSGKEELVDTLFTPLADQVRNALAASYRELQEEVSDPAELTRIYGRLAIAIASIIAPNLGVLRLYLQENRGPNVGARRPIVALSRDLEENAFELTRVAREHGLLRDDYNYRLGTLISVGAIERLLMAYLDDDAIASSDIASELIHVILDGVRASTAQ